MAGSVACAGGGGRFCSSCCRKEPASGSDWACACAMNAIAISNRGLRGVPSSDAMECSWRMGKSLALVHGLGNPCQAIGNGYRDSPTIHFFPLKMNAPAHQTIIRERRALYRKYQIKKIQKVFLIVQFIVVLFAHTKRNLWVYRNLGRRKARSAARLGSVKLSSDGQLASVPSLNPALWAAP